jgi:hypothetical protein
MFHGGDCRSRDLYQPCHPALRIGKGAPCRRGGNGGFQMDSVMFLDCPAYMDQRGTARCGLPAAVEGRYTVTSTDGPLESARIRCPRGHYFNGPLESLTWEKTPSAAPIARNQDAAPRRNR